MPVFLCAKFLAAGFGEGKRLAVNDDHILF
jgi:hypothetical protein